MTEEDMEQECLWCLKRTGCSEDESVISIDIGEEQEFVIGRKSLCNVGPFVSRKHLCLTRDENNFLFVQDLNSMNGVYLNGTKIDASILYPLYIDDTIGVGIPKAQSLEHLEFRLLHQPPTCVIHARANTPVLIDKTACLFKNVPPSGINSKKGSVIEEVITISSDSSSSDVEEVEIVSTKKRIHSQDSDLSQELLSTAKKFKSTKAKSCFNSLNKSALNNAPSVSIFQNKSNQNEDGQPAENCEEILSNDKGGEDEEENAKDDDPTLKLNHSIASLNINKIKSKYTNKFKNIKLQKTRPPKAVNKMDNIILTEKAKAPIIEEDHSSQVKDLISIYNNKDIENSMGVIEQEPITRQNKIRPSKTKQKKQSNLSINREPSQLNAEESDQDIVNSKISSSNDIVEPNKRIARSVFGADNASNKDTCLVSSTSEEEINTLLDMDISPIKKPTSDPKEKLNISEMSQLEDLVFEPTSNNNKTISNGGELSAKHNSENLPSQTRSGSYHSKENFDVSEQPPKENRGGRNVSKHKHKERKDPVLSELNGGDAERSKDPRIERIKTLKNTESSLNEPLFIPRLFPLNETKLNEENTLIGNILSWDVGWLDYCLDKDLRFPFDSLAQMRSVKISYSSLEDYIGTFYPILMTDIWEEILETWTLKNKTQGFTQTGVKDKEDLLEIAVISHQRVDNLIELHCRAVPSEIFRRRCSNCSNLYGQLIVVNWKKTKRFFGYIFETDSGQGGNVASDGSRKKGEEFAFKIKIRHEHFSSVDSATHPCSSVEVVSCIKSLVNRCKALLNIYKSHMLSAILKPLTSCSALNLTQKIPLDVIGEFNEKQKAVISAVTLGVMNDPSTANIFLINGAPGTGKSNTLIGTVQQLMKSQFKDNTPHNILLVVSAMNSSIDEITLRLTKIRNQIKMGPTHRKLRIVRIGNLENISRNVRAFSLAELTKSNTLISRKEKENRIDTELNCLKAKVNSLDHGIQAKLIRNVSITEFTALQGKRKVYMDHIEALKKEKKELSEPMTSETAKSLEHLLEIEIVKKADVVLTTLNDFNDGILAKLIAKPGTIQFSCLIVDDAALAPEPEILLPLQFDIKKMVLFGNCINTSNHFGSFSLYERLIKFFNESHSVASPVFSLTEQYRMHPELCIILSKLYYSYSLKTSPNVTKKFNIPFKPLALFDFERIQNYRGASMEHKFIAKLCSDILRVASSDISVGVMAPDTKQCETILTLLAKDPYPKDQIKVDTFEHFIGCEYEIVICVCLRNDVSTEKFSEVFSDAKMSNILLSRAHHSLFLCGYLSLLKHVFPWDELIRYSYQNNCYHLVDGVSEGFGKIKNY